MADTDDLAVLMPGREVTCKGETITVLPLFFGQYPKAGKLAKPIIAALRDANMFAFRQDGDKVKVDLAEGWIAELPGLLDDGGEAVLMFLAFAIGKPREWFDTLPGDEGFAVAQAVFGENQDFFVRKVLPMLQSAGLKLQAGATSSPDSATTDTPSPTSAA